MATSRDPRDRFDRHPSSGPRRGEHATDERERDYTRELSDRYGHGRGGYDRDAYPQGGYGGDGREDPGRARHALRDEDRDERGFSPRRSYREPEYGEGWQGDDHFSTGVFGGGTDQDFHSGGQYQGESGRGARSGQSGDFSGGGYLGRGTGSRPRREARSGGAFGESPRGWYGPGSGGGGGGGGDTSVGTGGHRGRGPRNYSRSDQRISEDLCERLHDDDHVDAGDIEVQVEQGVVTLSGTVPERRMKHRAEDIAEACRGVQDVDNGIRVSRAGESASGGSTAL